MKQLVFNFNLFDVGQKALIIDTDNNASIASYQIDKIDNAGSIIAKACVDTEITKVHLYGEANYLTNFVIPDIEENLYRLNYSNKNVEIEVN